MYPLSEHLVSIHFNSADSHSRFFTSRLKADRQMSEHWIAERMHNIDASGIRKVFDLAAKLTDPINLSIGQPHFDTPEAIKTAVKNAIDSGKNAYSQTQGVGPFRERIQADVDAMYGHKDRKALVTSGTSGALNMALSTLVGPGDEVIVFDPWFVMYKHLTTLAGGKVVEISTYPDFRIDIEKVRRAITDRTKVILFNSPSNPTGVVATASEVEGLAKLAAEKDICLISDEIYSSFCYDGPLARPAVHNDQTLVIDGFSKSHSMTGHRVGFCHGPAHIIEQMTKLQQFTFVCAPHPSQWGALAGVDVDISHHVEDYRNKRNLVRDALKDRYRIEGADGAFYMFIEAPGDEDDPNRGTSFVRRALEKNLLIIPGNVFSSRDTHFRISYAATDETLKRGIDVLLSLA